MWSLVCKEAFVIQFLIYKYIFVNIVYLSISMLKSFMNKT